MELHVVSLIINSSNEQQQQHPNDQHQQRRGYSMDGSNRNSLFYFSLMLCLHYDVFAPTQILM
jgi:hypothetical protein